MKKSACDDEVKCIFKNYSHRKCTAAKTRQYCKVVTGAVLNNYLLEQRDSARDPKHFNPRKQYNVCHTLYCLITKAANNEGTKTEETPPLLVVRPVVKVTNADIIGESQRTTTITPDEDNNVSRAQRLIDTKCFHSPLNDSSTALSFTKSGTASNLPSFGGRKFKRFALSTHAAFKSNPLSLHTFDAAFII